MFVWCAHRAKAFAICSKRWPQGAIFNQAAAAAGAACHHAGPFQSPGKACSDAEGGGAAAAAAAPAPPATPGNSPSSSSSSSSKALHHNKQVLKPLPLERLALLLGFRVAGAQLQMQARCGLCPLT
eukprot:scaffold16877_cov19-Tisochrysis_lutea.AAC.6